ncbi:MAG: GNAT family N-acetyltransferase [Gemmatimonadetes bacterium]|nr:GNAT family N-acetyltransferase [Gemmatimonadota bacterium]
MTTTRRAASPRPATPVVVRAATVEDMDVVVGLRLELLREERRSPLFARPRRDLAALTRELTATQLTARTEVTLLAHDGEEAVGLLRVSVSRGARLVHPTRYGFITSAFVRASHRRRGVLRLLLAEAELWCRTHGLREVRLHCTIENVEGNLTWDALGYAPAEVVRRRVLPTD